MLIDEKNIIGGFRYAQFILYRKIARIARGKDKKVICFMRIKFILSVGACIARPRWLYRQKKGNSLQEE